MPGRGVGRRRPAFGALIGFIALSAVVGVLAAAAVTPAIAVTGLASGRTIGIFNSLPDYLKIGPLAQISTMYAKQGGQDVPIARFYAQNRVEVGFTSISPYVKDAVVATEDPRFYSEGGIDLIGTLRGAFVTYVAKSGTQGGSSITQQYVKNVLVQKCDAMNVAVANPEKQAELTAKYRACYAEATGDSPSRKLREMRYAIGVDKRYTKDQILRGYLNIAGFGGSVYGIQAAAEYYFGVPASGLSLPEAATLVAMVNNPNYLRIDGGSVRPSETSAENLAADGFPVTLERRNYVLDQMYQEKKITREQRDAARATGIEPRITPVSSGCMAANAYSAGAFCDFVQRTIEADPAFGATADDRAALFARGGLNIHTTLDLDLQNQAQAALSAYVPKTLPNTDIGGTNVSVEVGTGRIITMVQNRPFDNTATPEPGSTSVNYNTDAAFGGSEGFQTGSSYKAFDLIEWLREGHSLGEIVDGTQHQFAQSRFHESPPCADIGGPPWPVANDDGDAGSISVLNATAESVNTAFAMMATKLDLCGIKQAAQDLLVHGADEAANPFRANPSSILGTNYIAPLTMATAYAGLANSGVACSAIAIDSVVSANGTKLPVPRSTCSTRPIDPAVAAAVIYALQGVLSHGTGVLANPHDGIPIFGKTGTADHSYDNWLVSSTTKTAQATWVGNVQAVQRAGGSYSKTPIRDLRLGGAYGGDAKLHVANAVIRALNAAYGGGAFPAVERKFLAAPSAPSPAPGPAPSAPATQAATPGAGSSATPAAPGASSGGAGGQ